MKKLFLIFLFIFWVTPAFASVTLVDNEDGSITPILTEPGVAFGYLVSSEGSYWAGQSGSPYVYSGQGFEGLHFRVLLNPDDNLCGPLNMTECYNLTGDPGVDYWVDSNDSVCFVDPLGGECQAASSGGGGGSNSTYTNFEPTIKFFKSFGRVFISGLVPVEYVAEDKNDLSNNESEGGQLDTDSVSLFYAKSNDLYSELAKNLRATGTFYWDTKKFPDGSDYRIKAHVVDTDGAFSEYIDGPITIDNTPPTFITTYSPSFSRGEPVQIKIESSESLIYAPVFKVSQLRHEPIDVTFGFGAPKRIFVGQYSPIKGFDGPVEVYVEGVDLAGNKNIVENRDGFVVGFDPPSRPTVDIPKDGLKTSSTTLESISGKAVNAKEIIIKVNNTKEYRIKNIKSDGLFSLKDIALNPKFDKGRNVISLVSVDELGALSEPSQIVIFVNSPPTISLVEPKSRALKLNGLINISWKANDINDDPLTYKIELSDDSGSSWSPLHQNTKESHFVWDSTRARDSSNYLIKVSVSDGSLGSDVVSHPITITNDLPAIILEESDSLFTSSKSKTISGMVRSKKDLLVKMELSLDNEKTWKAILPEDGRWGSAFERFDLVFADLKTGALEIVLRGISESGKIVTNAQGLKIVFDDQSPILASDFFSQLAPVVISKTRIVSLEGEGRDNFSGIKIIEYKIDDSAWFEALISGPVGEKYSRFRIDHKNSLVDGEHTLSARAIDRANNISKTLTKKFIVDATPPMIGSFILDLNDQILYPDQEGFFNMEASSTALFRIAIAGDPKKIVFKVNDRLVDLTLDRDSGLRTATLSFYELGVSRLSILAEDVYGNKVEKFIANVRVLEKDQVHTKAGLKKPSFVDRFFNLFDI
ncbi:MAG: hypothetical protein AB200_01265 [Parcubacteria bacterium C7867-005]|nr:MAG: hypothetical protein AB200_01265 [Parcubacteria bacterium C7867-005]